MIAVKTPPTENTLAHLRQLRMELIEKAQKDGLFADILLVCRELGEEYDAPYPWNREERGCYKRGDLELSYTAIPGAGYDVHESRFNERYRISVNVGDANVCYMHLWNGEPKAEDGQYWVTAGEWWQSVADLADEAEGKQIAVAQVSQNAERDSLAERLLVEGV